MTCMLNFIVHFTVDETIILFKVRVILNIISKDTWYEDLQTLQHDSCTYKSEKPD